VAFRGTVHRRRTFFFFFKIRIRARGWFWSGQACTFRFCIANRTGGLKTPSLPSSSDTETPTYHASRSILGVLDLGSNLPRMHPDFFWFFRPPPFFYMPPPPPPLFLNPSRTAPPGAPRPLQGSPPILLPRDSSYFGWAGVYAPNVYPLIRWFISLNPSLKSRSVPELRPSRSLLSLSKTSFHHQKVKSSGPPPPFTAESCFEPRFCP